MMKVYDTLCISHASCAPACCVALRYLALPCVVLRVVLDDVVLHLS